MTQPPDEPEQPAPEPGAASGRIDGYGRSPDPSGAYPSPDQGGFAPLPDLVAGDYLPPGPGYSGADAGSTPQATDSLRRAWRIFADNPAPFVLSQLIWAAIFVIPVALLLLAFGAWRATDGGSRVTTLLGTLFGVGGLVTVLVVVLLAVVQQGAFASATLKAVDGERVGVADFFRPRHLVQLVVLALILGLASAVLAITGIGPLIVLFFGVWAVLLVVERGVSAIEAVRLSISASLNQPGQTIVLVLAGYVMNAIGAMLCGLGTLVSMPVGLLAFADHYRRSAAFSRP